MKSPVKKKDKMKQGTRERIVRAGVKLFQANGYHGAGLAEILDRAGAPKGSMYHHFPGGKEDLALAALTWIASEVDAFLDARRSEGAGGTQMALGMAEYYAGAVANADGMRGSLVSVLAQDAVPGSTRIRAALDDVVTCWTKRLTIGFELDGSRKPAERARRTLALLEGAMILARIEGDPERVVRIVAEGLAEDG